MKKTTATTKVAAINPELLEAAKAEYFNAYPITDDMTERQKKYRQEMRDFYVKRIGGIVRLENGMLFIFEKPSIETSFCFGYGDYGRSDDESARIAHKNCENIRQKENFFRANMDDFLSNYSWLGYASKYKKANELGKDCYGNPVMCCKENNGMNFCFFASDTRCLQTVGLPTETDLKNLRKECERVKAAFLKRLETYWKKYQGTKLHTWTYLRD